MQQDWRDDGSLRPGAVRPGAGRRWHLLRALRELRDGRKRSHWSGSCFRRSPVSDRVRHPSGTRSRPRRRRSRTCGTRSGTATAGMCGRAQSLDGRSAVQVSASIDAQKLRSSMTLFLRADPAEQAFQQVLDRYFDGLPDPATDRCSKPTRDQTTALVIAARIGCRPGAPLAMGGPTRGRSSRPRARQRGRARCGHPTCVDGRRASRIRAGRARGTRTIR